MRTTLLLFAAGFMLGLGPGVFFRAQPSVPDGEGFAGGIPVSGPVRPVTGGTGSPLGSNVVAASAAENLLDRILRGVSVTGCLGDLARLHTAGNFSPDEAEFLIRMAGRRLDPSEWRAFRDTPEYGALTDRLRKSLLAGQAESHPDETIADCRRRFGNDLEAMSSGEISGLFAGAFVQKFADYDALVGQVHEKHRYLVAAALAKSMLRTRGIEEANEFIGNRIRSGDELALSRGEAELDTLMLDAGVDAALRLAEIKAAESGDTSVAFGMFFGMRYPAEALEWVATQESRPDLIGAVVSATAMKHPDLALDFAAEFDSTRENKIALLEGLSTAFRSTGQDDWLEQCQELLKKLATPDAGAAAPNDR